MCVESTLTSLFWSSRASPPHGEALDMLLWRLGIMASKLVVLWRKETPNKQMKRPIGLSQHSWYPSLQSKHPPVFYCEPTIKGKRNPQSSLCRSNSDFKSVQMSLEPGWLLRTWPLENLSISFCLLLFGPVKLEMKSEPCEETRKWVQAMRGGGVGTPAMLSKSSEVSSCFCS